MSVKYRHSNFESVLFYHIENVAKVLVVGSLEPSDRATWTPISLVERSWASEQPNTCSSVLCSRGLPQLALASAQEVSKYCSNSAAVSVHCTTRVGQFSNLKTTVNEPASQVHYVDLDTFYEKISEDCRLSRFSAACVDMTSLESADIYLSCLMLQHAFASRGQGFCVVIETSMCSVQRCMDLFKGAAAAYRASSVVEPVSVFNLKRPSENYISDIFSTVKLLLKRSVGPSKVLVWMPLAADVRLLIDRLSAATLGIGRICSLLSTGDLQKKFHFAPMSSTVVVAVSSLERLFPSRAFDYVIDSGLKSCTSYGKAGLPLLSKAAISEDDARERAMHASSSGGQVYRLYTHDFSLSKRPSNCTDRLFLRLVNLVKWKFAVNSAANVFTSELAPLGSGDAVKKMLEKVAALGFFEHANGDSRSLLNLASILQWDSPGMLKALHVALISDDVPDLVLQIGTLLQVCDGKVSFLARDGKVKARFLAEEGDFLTCLNIFHAFEQARELQNKTKDSTLGYRFCKEFNLKHEKLSAAYAQYESAKLALSTPFKCSFQRPPLKSLEEAGKVNEQLWRALAAGLYCNLAELSDSEAGEYRLCLESSSSSSSNAGLEPLYLNANYRRQCTKGFPKCVMFYKSAKLERREMYGVMVVRNPRALADYVSEHARRSSAKHQAALNSVDRPVFKRKPIVSATKKDLSKYL